MTKAEPENKNNAMILRFHINWLCEKPEEVFVTILAEIRNVISMNAHTAKKLNITIKKSIR